MASQQLRCARAVYIAAMILLLSILQVPSLASDLQIRPVKLHGDRENVELPGRYSKMCFAASGRLMVFWLSEKQQAAVFDVAELKVIKLLPFDGKDVLLAGGRFHLAMADADSRKVSVFDLRDYTEVITKKVEAKGPLAALAMGRDSLGPLLVIDRGKDFSETVPKFFELESLEPLPKTGISAGFFEYGKPILATATPDGQIFSARTARRAHCARYILRSGSVVHWKHVSGFAPDDRGRRFYGPDGVFDVRGISFVPRQNWRKLGFPVPALSGPLLYRAAFISHLDGSPTPVYLQACDNPDETDHLGLIANVELGKFDNDAPADFQRVFLLPRAKALVALPYDNDSVTVHRFDLEEVLESATGDYLFVAAHAQQTAKIGESFQYHIDVRTNHPPVKFEVKSASDGLSVSPTGEVRWTPTAKPVGGAGRAELIIRDDGGQQIEYTFQVDVDTDAGSKPFHLVGERFLQLPGGTFSWESGINNTALIVRSGAHLAELGADGITVRNQLELPESCDLAGLRKDYLIVVTSDRPATVQLRDRKTARIIKSIPLPRGIPQALALHPYKAFCYVALRQSYDTIPGCRFVVVDEERGKAHESEEFIGNSLAVDPTGRMLVAGYHDQYRRGSELVFNPRQIISVPKYGHLNWMLTYDIARDGALELRGATPDAGAITRGVRFSGKGDRIAAVGYQLVVHLRNPRDYSEVAKRIATDTTNGHNDAAFHPVFDMLAVIKGESAQQIALVNPDTGEAIEDVLHFDAADLRGQPAKHLRFSPDGKHLIAKTQVNGRDYLVRFDLNLDARQTRQLDEFANRLNVPPQEQPPRRVPLSDLHALRSGLGKAMDTETISHWFNDSVVVLKNDEGAGAGFVVGSDGYILTCAHCVPQFGPTNVTYRVRSGNEVEKKRVRAEVLRVDDRRDLALLKIDVTSPLRSVRLAHTGRAGQRVCIIGHPGSGETILEHTITEGIVSNADRELDGQRYLQTSAAINPGNSGGPMFNDHGLVIGMVVRKAQLEGAGFAIPTQVLTKFLVEASTITGDSLRLRRDWVDASGRRVLDAVLTGIGESTIQLRRADGRRFSVKLQQLSPADRQFIGLLSQRR